MALKDGMNKAAEIESHKVEIEVTCDAQDRREVQGLDRLGYPERKLPQEVLDL